MSTTFIVCLIVAIAAVAYWRLTLIICLAMVIALLATGVSTIAGALPGDGAQSPPVVSVEQGDGQGTPPPPR